MDSVYWWPSSPPLAEARAPPMGRRSGTKLSVADGWVDFVRFWD
ncbi:hypothetical protein TIFTF001_033341 [Ficus carica]|uniref:Uncharacterized protein n=1 Tax=Ficus carica TaxID=3494 RepID=A0AA88DYP9_FICCA|nr:hypothetical protein TIFTF001_033341 [Ficus carica]